MMNVPEDPPDVELFEVPPSDDEAPGAPNWKAGLQSNKQGPLATLGNAIHALALSEEWRGVISFNAFDGSVVKTREPPMKPHERPTDYQLGEWTDADTSFACAWLARIARVRLHPGPVGRAVYAIALRNRIHPVRGYLEKLEWDGKLRVADWLSTYLGAEKDSYSE